MLFNSYEFLFLFMPLILLGYYVLFAQRGRLVFLTVMSYIFYGWWDYRFCSLMLFTTVVDFLIGKRIHLATTKRSKKGWLITSIVSNLGLLGFFKYYDLMAQTTNQMAGLFSGASYAMLPILHIVLPVGISFYTFQSLSYTIDLYRGDVKPAPSIWNFACFVSLFPQLVAGPIIRYQDLADQLVERTHSLSKVADGITFFILGLAKKVILADGVAPLVSEVFDKTIAPGVFASWSGVLAYAMQIYFDFSGYSDMAVGLGLMLGFKFPQNFNSPYKAVSITDFWRRWHISLSTWLRDYLYIPLGGNRLGPYRTYVNLFITMLLGGLWHGANWTFMLWGGYHGILLALERAFGKRGLFGWTPLVFKRFSTFVLVLIGWVFFRCPSMEQAFGILGGMLGLHGLGLDILAGAREHMLAWYMLPLSLMLAWFAPNTWEMRWPWSNPSPWMSSAAWAVGVGLLLVVSVGVILVNSSSPFLYFQF
ncbi:MAG: MBOAT family protein [Geobacteraceae bacterium]|nr:MBOAT family protein [Geobacteraceae bacterium]